MDEGARVTALRGLCQAIGAVVLCGLIAFATLAAADRGLGYQDTVQQESR